MNKDTQLIWEASRKSLDNDLIKQLYDQGLSPEKIGKQFGVSHIPIYSRLKQMGVKRRPFKQRHDLGVKLDDDLIKQLYNQGASTIEIGKQLGASHSTILTRLKGLGVKIRPSGRSLGGLDNDLIKQLYIDQGLSAEKIGKQLGVSSTAIFKRLRQMGVAIISQAQREYARLDSDLIKQLYDQGKSQAAIAKQLDTTPTTIARRLRQMGVEARPFTASGKERDTPKKYKPRDKKRSPTPYPDADVPTADSDLKDLIAWMVQYNDKIRTFNDKIRAARGDKYDERNKIELFFSEIDNYKAIRDLANEKINQMSHTKGAAVEIQELLRLIQKIDAFERFMHHRYDELNKRYKEGKRVIRKITSPVRSGDLIRDSKEANELQNDGFLTCNKCGLQPSKDYYHRGEKVTRDQSWKIIEGHHIDGVQEKDATPDDIEMLCKNCHIYETRIKI